MKSTYTKCSTSQETCSHECYFSHMLIVGDYWLLSVDF